MAASGLFEIRTPSDLLAKVKRDFVRLRASPNSSDIAFDLFVAARHVPDWVQSAGGQAASASFAASVELRICRHLADGAKHFAATHPQHKQVLNAVAKPGGFDTEVFDEGVFDTGRLEIELDPRDPDTAALGARIDVIDLATAVIRELENIAS